MASIKTDVIYGVKWNAISNAIVVVLRVLQVAILTRFLEKSDFGLIGIALLFYNFSNIIVQMGFGTVVIHEQNLSKGVFSSLYWANILLGIIVTILIILISPLVASYYDTPELVGVVSYISLMILFGSFFSLQQTVQLKKMNFRFINIINIISALFSFGLSIWLAIEGYRVYSLVWALLAGNVLCAVVYAYLGFFHERNIVFHLKYNEIREALKIGSFQMGSSSLDFFAREMDSFIISTNFSLSFFGVYTLCKNLTTHIYGFFNPIITNALTPAYAKIQNEADRIKQTYVKCVDIIGCINFYFYGVVGTCALTILGVLYGELYTQYSFVLLCLCVYYAQQSMGNPVGSLIIAKGRTDLGFYWTIFRIVFVFIYMFALSYGGNVNLFMITLALLPLLTIYPFWKISLCHLIDISFWETLGMSAKPFIITLPLWPLALLSMIINSFYVSGIVIAVIFTCIYVCLNYIFRRSLFIEIIDNVLSFVRR